SGQILLAARAMITTCTCSTPRAAPYWLHLRISRMEPKTRLSWLGEFKRQETALLSFRRLGQATASCIWVTSVAGWPWPLQERRTDITRLLEPIRLQLPLSGGRSRALSTPATWSRHSARTGHAAYTSTAIHRPLRPGISPPQAARS